MLKKIPPIFWLLGTLSLIIRIYYSGLATFQRDEIVIYEKALDFYLNGNLHKTGADIIYSETKLPGSLLNLLTGIPLFLTKGLPCGSAYMVAFLNFLSSLVMYKLYEEIFPTLNKTALFLFIVFAPWSIFQAEVTNPNFLPVFSSLFFFGIWKILNSNKSFWGAALCGFAYTTVIQLHMSVMLLLALSGLVLITRFSKFPNILGLASGAATGALTLIPYYIYEWKPSTNKFFLSNIVFSPNHFEDFTRIYTRFISFASGESARFFGRRGGMKRVAEVANLEPWTWLPYVIGTLATIIILFFGIRFFIIRGKWILKDENFFMNYRKLKDLNPIEKMDILIWVLPLITYISFLFSIKGPSAHAYWILMPSSFYSVLRSIELSKQKERFMPKFIGVYIVAVLLSTVTLTRISPYVFSINKTIEFARDIHSKTTDPIEREKLVEAIGRKEDESRHYKRGVRAVIHSLNGEFTYKN